MSKTQTYFHSRTRAIVAGLAFALILAVAAFGWSSTRARNVGTPAERKTEVGVYGRTGQPPVISARELQAPAPLFEDLGALTWPVTTRSAEAQAYFDQGLRLSYAFNHPESRRAFQEAQRLDPTCAMCFWGEALVLGPNINAPMEPAANEPALAALARAKALLSGATGKERDLVEALGKRYSSAPGAERPTLDLAYADAMGALARKYPDDPEIATLHAESLMDLSPWDYWEEGGTRPKGRTGELVATLEKTLSTHPDHPGAIHLYIHTVEASSAPERAEPYADRLAALMPGAGHLVHMPSHTYYRIGRYLDALRANRDAVEADERYIDRIRGQSPYTAMYYPHNVHFLMAAAEMAGDGPTAIAAAGKLATLITDETARGLAVVQPVKAAPYFAHVLFGTPDELLALARPAEGLPYIEAMWRYARATAFVRKGDLPAAEAEADAIGALAHDGDFSAFAVTAIPGVPVLNLAREIVLGRIAQAKGAFDPAIAHFERAAALQDGLAYMEPPYWYYPVRQTLGASLLRAGRTEEAEKAFRAALNRAPNNGWALFGLAETLRARSDEKGAAEVEARLGKTWAGDRAQLDLDRL